MKEYIFYIAMVVVQLTYGGSHILIKISLHKGLSQLVFVVCRHLIAMLLLGPFAYVLERMEKLKIISMRSQAKVLGTAICIYGSLLFTFWKGQRLLKGFVEKPLINIKAGSVDSNQIRKHQSDDSKVPEISTKDAPVLNPVREEA
ncbi:hypothetical protein FEM48_Zijuj03G0034600 [Ziziphus jujuba var. spinosa]|uniref:WAT1-related protein n=1 Tax=Ziziphus jujuba var. spinosa TaxID=714518 RepID=A0A978VMX1_ZIZJJ|nr:hypothetical protein FEM48_Zijuj03G0034600 [Ziziphus jujuba var. spinosa]